MGTLRFNLRSDKKLKDGTCPVELIYQVEGQRKYFNTGIKLREEMWDPKIQKALYLDRKTAKKLLPLVDYDTLPTNRDIEEYNQTLNSFKSTIKDIERVFEINKEPYSSQKVIDKLKTSKTPLTKKEGDEGATNFVEYLDKFIIKCEKGLRTNDSGKPLSESTIKIYRTLRRNVKQFQEKYRTTIFLTGLNLEFFEDFKEYLTTSLKYSTNTLGKHIRTLKVVVNEAREDNLTTAVFQGKRYRALSEKVDNIYLHQHELTQLFNLDLSQNTTLDRARDLFLLGAHTALRFSDWLKLNPAKVKNDIIIIQTEKTGVKVAVPINDVIKSIFKKYKDTKTGLPPKMTNQEVNRYIKDVCSKLDGFKELHELKFTKAGKKIIKHIPKFEMVSTHTARRSAASNMYHDKVPVLSIMALTGHRTETNFMTYIKITPEEHAEKIIEINNRKRLKVV